MPRAPRAALANRHSPESGCTTGFPLENLPTKIKQISPIGPEKATSKGVYFGIKAFLLIVEATANTPIEVSK